MKNQKQNKSSGFVVLASVVIISAVGLSLSVFIILSGLGLSLSSFTIDQSNQAKSLANACAEAALQEINDDNNFTGTNNLSIADGTCTYTVTNEGGENRKVEAAGTVGEVTRRVEIDVNQITPMITFSPWQEVSGDGGGGPSCVCGSWADGSCGGGSCGSDEIEQTRTCTPSGCDTESRCMTDSCGSWADGSCGGGACNSDEMEQIRTCTYGCLAESQCAVDSCGLWADQGCGGGSCNSDEMYQTRTCTFGCLAESQCYTNPLAGSFSFVNDSQSDFNNGTYSNTQWDSGNSWAELTIGGQFAGTGNFTSEIEDAGADASWDTISWQSSQPFYKELPDNGSSESAYSTGNANMNSNVLLMHLNESSGTISDSSGNGNNGSYNGSLYNQEGKLNISLGFDGSNDEIIIPDDSSLDFTNNITASAWVYFNSTSGWQSVFHKNNTIANRRELYLENYYGILWNYNTIRTSGVVLSAGQWNHIVYTADSNYERLYVNGQMVAQENNQFNGMNNSHSFYIGGSGGGGEQVNGRIDEVALWSRTLDSTEVTALYRRGANRLLHQVRSCDDASCSGESFIGPDGAGSTYYSEIDNSTTGLPSFNLTNVSDNQYFQYRTTFETDDSSLSPDLEEITVDYEVPGCP